MDDLNSCIIGFKQLCEKLLHNATDKNVFITPSIINTDAIENEFNQQRSTYNGANSNPKCLQYQQTLNSIIPGQSIISKKSKAGKTFAKAQPFVFQQPNPRKRKTNPVCYDPPKSIKIMRL
ncbi:hypothetical protein KP79_PYT22813 [Mizuhopecten yessoensis]|uniref:Uncharacterized protein n=1 Tax=Mizuhopecten yessoensis TaxID=6573 RepID=A0A210Q6M9_MIZYE|nr:hypothetical protein KP79_PYT22813 [Mizuhopecten yessoensis]